jgi:DNA polymerase III subunit gamma/tau
VMLRTFDDLGYRQEQRFHFELGLLKLVHLRRLLPVEEIMSQFAVPGGSGQSKPRSPAMTSPASIPVRPAAPVASAPAATRPAFSPFEADRNRKRVEEPTKPAPVPAPPSVPPVSSVRKNEPAPAQVQESEPEMTVTEVAADLLGAGAVPVAALEPEASVTSVPAASAGQSADELQRVVLDALMNAKSQTSAADALSEAEWSVENGEIRVQTELSKTMLPVVVNPEADKIVRAALRSAGAGTLKLVLLPGAGSGSAAAKKPKPVRSGSAQAKALEHPVVQQAQKLFDAQIRNVIDLSDNN